MLVASTIAAAMVAVAAIFIRMRAAKRPASVKKIVLPPIFMSTGAFMFFIPYFQVSFSQVIEALVVGAAFSIILIKTSNFEIKDGAIYLKRSKAFVFILFGLLTLRIILKTFLGTYFDVSLGELSGMFFLLAFGMIVPWRISMYYSFKKLEQMLQAEKRNIKHPIYKEVARPRD